LHEDQNKKILIDPLEGPKLALSGQIVTMNPAGRVLKKGTVFIEMGGIVAVCDDGEAGPAGFDSVEVTETQGTIFPGLIELHNHLSYNILRLWNVPRKFGNRGAWAGIPEYRQLVSGPMSVIGRTLVSCRRSCVTSSVNASWGESQPVRVLSCSLIRARDAFTAGSSAM
jgi:cytosine/adenosine deaminase-related metal-dependent hydrolase